MGVAASMSQTFDEYHHIKYGSRILQGQPDRSEPFLDIKTPVTALNALPREIAEHIDSSGRVQKFFVSRTMARFPSVLAAMGVIFFIHRLVYELYGREAALGAALLAALSPNLIAHGTLVATDGYLAFGVVSALYFFRRYLLEPTTRNAWISGLALAIAQIMKPLAVLLYPPVFLVLLVVALRRPARISTKGIAIYVAAAVVSCILILNVAYLFDRTLTPLSAYRFQTPFFRSLQGALPNVPVPAPYPVLQGFDMAVDNDATGRTYGNLYLLGSLRRGNDPDFQGFWSYYVVAWLFKEPIALQFLFFLGLVHVWRRRTARDYLPGEGLLLTFSICFVLALSVLSKAQIGIRHILPVLAVEIVFAGAAFSGWSTFSSRRKRLMGVLVTWLAVSMFSYYPHMIPYMNEWVPDRKMAFQVLADSNLDWGQSTDLVLRFLKANPDVMLNPEAPVSGRIIVSANLLVGVDRRGPLDWALQYRPIEHVGYSHLVFQIPESGAARGPVH
jgi:4-amino-4-deoxy-L-arabinose transferase-like glycosyltransferase